MKVDTKTLPPSARRSVRGSYMTRLSGDGIVVQSWPRKRGMAKQGYPLYQQIEFGMAARMAADPGNDARILAEYWAKGSQMVWRDVQQKLILGVFWDIELADGTRLESWRMGNGNPLYWLDLISSTPGAIVYRSGIGWIALLPGGPGKVLTLGVDGVSPQWVTPSSGGSNPLFQPPLAASFPTLLNSPVLTDDALFGLQFTGAAGGTLLRAALKPLAGDKTYIAHFDTQNASSATEAGIMIRDSVGGRCTNFGIDFDPALRVHAANWNNVNSFAGDLSGYPVTISRPDCWFKLVWHSAARTVDAYWSTTGSQWRTIATGIAFGPHTDQIGLQVWSTTTSGPTAGVPYGVCDYWSET